eukprot:GDKJ01043242.1.p1 GENE.GDKJ01043242.1~~GDKJ01043242.1.p1  ORF type:complete len:413 (-),score=117.35 GDKJ01043242.1:176-1336(-)
MKYFSTLANMELVQTEQIKMTLSNNGTLSVTLNRPAAFNALSDEMVAALNENLPVLEKSDAVKCVIVTGEGPKAFCAGGDIRKIADGTPEQNASFFDLEYQMDHRTHTFKKPFISIWNGFVMGGGLGVSVHGRYRVATDNVVVAMPETGIGLFPDVGGSFFLPRLRGASGLYIGLTGARLNAVDCMNLGVSSHFVATAAVPDLVEALKTVQFSNDTEKMHSEVEEILKKFSSAPQMKASISEADYEAIEAVMGDCESVSFEKFVQRLIHADKHFTGHNLTFANALLANLRKKCPLSCGVWYDLYLKGRRDHSSLFQALCLELKLAQYFSGSNPYNFKEGVRVTLVNKGDTPKYEPATLEEMSQGVIDEVFEIAMRQERNLQADGLL